MLIISNVLTPASLRRESIKSIITGVTCTSHHTGLTVTLSSISFTLWTWHTTNSITTACCRDKRESYLFWGIIYQNGNHCCIDGLLKFPKNNQVIAFQDYSPSVRQCRLFWASECISGVPYIKCLSCAGLMRGKRCQGSRSDTLSSLLLTLQVFRIQNDSWTLDQQRKPPSLCTQAEDYLSGVRGRGGDIIDKVP